MALLEVEFEHGITAVPRGGRRERRMEARSRTCVEVPSVEAQDVAPFVAGAPAGSFGDYVVFADTLYRRASEGAQPKGSTVPPGWVLVGQSGLRRTDPALVPARARTLEDLPLRAVLDSDRDACESRLHTLAEGLLFVGGVLYRRADEPLLVARAVARTWVDLPGRLIGDAVRRLRPIEGIPFARDLSIRESCFRFDEGRRAFEWLRLTADEARTADRWDSRGDARWLDDFEVLRPDLLTYGDGDEALRILPSVAKVASGVLRHGAHVGARWYADRDAAASACSRRDPIAAREVLSRFLDMARDRIMPHDGDFSAVTLRFGEPAVLHWQRQVGQSKGKPEVRPDEAAWRLRLHGPRVVVEVVRPDWARRRLSGDRVGRVVNLGVLVLPPMPQAEAVERARRAAERLGLRTDVLCRGELPSAVVSHDRQPWALVATARHLLGATRQVAHLLPAEVGLARLRVQESRSRGARADEMESALLVFCNRLAETRPEDLVGIGEAPAEGHVEQFRAAATMAVAWSLCVAPRPEPAAERSLPVFSP